MRRTPLIYNVLPHPSPTLNPHERLLLGGGYSETSSLPLCESSSLTLPETSSLTIGETLSLTTPETSSLT